MTLPDERYRSIQWAERFLIDLCDPKKTPRVPKEVRRQASSILRHYPSKWDLDQMASLAPSVIVERMEPLHRMVVSWESQDSESVRKEGN
jgi:hypothetical protein